MIMIIPFILFWVLIVLGYGEIGMRWTLVLILLWFLLLAGFMALGVSPYIWVALQSLVDIILILAVFKGDLHIR